MRIFAQVKAGEMNHDECSDAIDSVLSPLPKVNCNWDKVIERYISEYGYINIAQIELISWLKQHYSTPVSPSDEAIFKYIKENEPYIEEHDEGGFLGIDERELAKYISTYLRSIFTEERKTSGKAEYGHSKEDMRNMLEGVVNELDLSEEMINKHGQEGTTPATLVRLVLEEKDRKIRALKAGLTELTSPTDK